jgi:CRP-like cAMP-binding protein
MNNIMQMDSITLSRLAFFDGLNLTHLELLSPYFVAQFYVAGTTVFEQGDNADYLYLVVKGEAVIRYKPDDGPAMTVTCVKPGGIFGWSAAMGNPAYTSGAVCAVDSDVLQIRGTDLRKLCEQYPEVGKYILARLAAVIAERKQSHRQVTSMLANGIRQVESRGGVDNGREQI